MTALAPTLQAFFTTRLGRERDASPHTVDSYRHAFRLLLAYARAQTGRDPSDLDLADLDAALISGFLDHLERDLVEQRRQPQHPAGCHPLVLPVRLLSSS